MPTASVAAPPVRPNNVFSPTVSASLLICSVLTGKPSAVTVPRLTSAPQRSASSWTTSRRLTRYRPLSSATTACSRGPKLLASTAAGALARVTRPQARHRRAASRYSVTSTASGGSSSTCCRSAAGSPGPAAEASGAPQPVHSTGTSTTT